MESIEELKNFHSGNPINVNELIEAEKILNVKFAEDYKEIILKYGIVSGNGHELTGLCNSKRLNVIDVTLNERKRNSKTCGLYVIEQANVDGIVIWQDSNGKVYKTIGNSDPVAIFNSILCYING